MKKILVSKRTWRTIRKIKNQHNIVNFSKTVDYLINVKPRLHQESLQEIQKHVDEVIKAKNLEEKPQSVNLDIIRGRVWLYFWPLLIIAAGLWIIFKPRFGLFKEKAPEIKEKDLDAFIIFSGIKRRFNTPEFRGGKATALFGGIDLDFAEASLADNKATIELTAIFGGIEVFVPRDWEVVVDSSSIFGAVEDKHKSAPPAETKATLFIRATVMFGGIEIK